MTRKIVRFVADGAVRWGELASEAPHQGDDEIDVIEYPTTAETTAALLARIARGEWPGPDGMRRRIRARQLQSPVTADGRIVCQGLNYGEHSAGDAGIHQRRENLFFSKASSSITGPYDDIVQPGIVEMLDYEVEVGLVLRRDVPPDTTVDAANIGAFIAGMVLCNDVSARDIMFGAPQMQWWRGKSFRTFCPTGPVFYLLDPADVAGTIASLRISLTWKGQARQTGVTSQMIFKPADTLTELSTFMDLHAGDLLLTGTPGGVIAKGTSEIYDMFRRHLLNDFERRAEFRIAARKAVGDFMQPGDVVTTKLEDARTGDALGGQRNTIVAGHP